MCLERYVTVCGAIVQTVRKLYKLDGLDVANCLERDLMEHCVELDLLDKEMDGPARSAEEDA